MLTEEQKRLLIGMIERGEPLPAEYHCTSLPDRLHQPRAPMVVRVARAFPVLVPVIAIIRIERVRVDWQCGQRNGS